MLSPEAETLGVYLANSVYTCSFVWIKLNNWQSTSQGTSMPQTGGPLTSAQLNIVGAWIDEGAGS